jgi:hypothetical protein
MKHRPTFIAFASGLLAGLALGVCGCGNASPVNKPVESAAAPITTQPVVTGNANDITTAVESSIKQVQNEVLPWLLAVGIVVLAGCGVIVAMLLMGFWLIRKWIERNSYLEQKPVYEAACRTED